jgi:membrane protease YdiL (CAAX protease family)
MKIFTGNTSFRLKEQYNLKQILAIWLLSALPMGILTFVITPILVPLLKLPPIIVYWICINVGLIWQFILSVIILKKEKQQFTWSKILKRTKYQRPVNPKNGKASYWLLLWVVPFILLSWLIQSGTIVLPNVDKMITSLIKSLPKYDMSQLATENYKGAWWIAAMYLITMVFNYFLGEEFLYRGILLPKMRGVFGKWDWFANGVLFGFYHLHKPQIILSTALYFGFVFGFPSKLFQSNWMGLIIHGLEGILGLVIILSLLL